MNIFWNEGTREEFSMEVDSFLERQGGVKAIVDRMERLGMGSLAHAWVEAGEFEPIFGEQLHQLFGTGVLRAWAAKLDLLPRDLVRRLSQSLPQALQRLATGHSNAHVTVPPSLSVRPWGSLSRHIARPH